MIKLVTYARFINAHMISTEPRVIFHLYKTNQKIYSIHQQLKLLLLRSKIETRVIFYLYEIDRKVYSIRE